MMNVFNYYFYYYFLLIILSCVLSLQSLKMHLCFLKRAVIFTTSFKLSILIIFYKYQT